MELTDEQVFGTGVQQELSDEQVFGSGGEVGFDDRIQQQDGMLPESGNERGASELNAFSLPLALLGKAVAGIANPVYNLVTGYDPKEKIMRFGGPGVPSDVPLSTERGDRFQAGQTVFKDPSFARPLREDIAVNRGLNSLWEGITTPEGLATAGGGMLIRAPGLVGDAANLLTKTGEATFLLDMLGHALESTAKAAGSLGTYVGTPEQERTPELTKETQDAVLNEVFNKLFLGLGGLHLRDSLKVPVDPTIHPDVLPPKSNPVVSANRRLEAPQGDIIDLEQSGGVYRAPTDVAKQIEGPKRQFVTDEMGQTIPREQFDPMQGQDALAHRQPLQGYRPAPPVIETPEVAIHNTLKSIEAKLNEFVRAQKPEPKIVPAWQASGDVKGQGGQISFGAEAEAYGIPNSQQQSALSKLRDLERNPKPEVSNDLAPQDAPSITGEVIRHEGRDIVLVQLPNGELQPFYKSTGRNSGMPGRWLPFDGLEAIGETGKSWFNKTRFTNIKNLNLERFGSQKFKDVSDHLAKLNIREGKEVTGTAEVNAWLDAQAKRQKKQDSIVYRNTGPFTKEQQDAMNAFLRRAIDAAIKAGKELSYEDLQALRADGTDRLRKGLPLDTERLPDIRGGATKELMGKGNDAASLPAPAKMISGEGQSSGVESKAAQIEDGKIIRAPITHKDPFKEVENVEKETDPEIVKDNFNNYQEGLEWAKLHGTPDDVETEGMLRDAALVRYIEVFEKKPDWGVVQPGKKLNPGGSQASLPPAQQAVSKKNNSLEAFAKQNGVEYVEGDTGQTILQKINAKKKSGSTVESVKEETVPDKVEIQHILGNAAQLVKSAEYAGDITKEQSAEFQRRGDEAFANLESNPKLAHEQAKKLREDVSPKNTDPKYGTRRDSSGNLYGGIPYLDPNFWKDNFGEKSHVQRDAKQLYNFIRNKLGSESAKWKALNTPEFQKLMLSGGTKSVDEVMPWVQKQEEGYRSALLKKNEEWWGGIKKQTETHTYGMEGKVSEAKKEYDRMTHEWYDNLPQNERYYVRDLKAYGHQEGGEAYANKENGPISKDTQEKAQKYVELEKRVNAEPDTSNSPRATSHYNTVSALPTNEPMPEWTTTKSGKNVQRVDVVIPKKSSADLREDALAGRKQIKTPTLWEADNLHENLPNTLGWAMIQYKTIPGEGYRATAVKAPDGTIYEGSWHGEARDKAIKAGKLNKQGSNGQDGYVTKSGKWVSRDEASNEAGYYVDRNNYGGLYHNEKPPLHGEKRVAVIAEAQSRWGQSIREIKEARDNAAKEGATEKQIAGYNRKLEAQGHPLLKDYNRLILKAAIEQARKEGATHIVVSDSKSALMTEGLDTMYKKYASKELAEQAAAKQRTATDNYQAVEHGGEWYVTKHEKGFDFAYDTALPKIAEELTGNKGEKVSLGEHKNVMATEPGSTNYHVEDTEKGWEVKDEHGRTESIHETQESAETHSDRLNESTPRSNLIFRNPDGTPKTDVSGQMFRIDDMALKTETPVSKPSGGIGHGISAAVEKNKEAGAILNPFRKVNRPIKTSEFQDVQSFKPYADEVFDSTQPHGVGRIPGLSRLFDPRAYRTTPDGEAIIANAVMSQKGQNFAALWQERQRDVQRVFETTDGTFKDANGRPAYMSDMIEAEMRNPGSQPLTAGQRNFIKEWKDLRKKIVDMATKEGVQFFVDDNGNVVPINENYFPRQAIGKVGIKETIRENVRKSVGGKQSFMKGRQYDTEAEGAAAGIKYEPDEFNRIGRWMASVYKAIADTRLAKDPLMQGRKQGRPKFLEEGQVFQPAFAGRIFPKEVAARLNRYYGEQPYNWLRSLSSINDNLKALQFTLDVSAPFNQGLPLMGVNPLRWAKATALSWKALLDDRTMTKYLKQPENAKAAKTILENNGSLVRLQDFLVGAAEGRGLHNIAPIRASGRSMGTFLTVAKIEMFKAFEPIADKKGWSKTELVEAVENAVLSGKMEMLGLSQGRAMGERLLSNAPSYIRGAVNLTAMAAQGKISGKVARRAIVGMAVAISTTMYALYKSQGMSDEEITKRFDPRNPNFYRYPHLMSNGQRVELSYGNIMISLARLAGTSVDTVSGKKEYGPGTKGDPWLRWLSYRKSPVAGLALQMYTGEDFRGEPTGKTETLLRSMLPVSMEPLTDKAQASEGKIFGLPESKAIGVGSQLFGLNSFPESKGAFRQRQTEEISQRDFNLPFTKLGAVDRGFVSEEAKNITDKTIDTKTTPRQVMNIVTDTEKRRTNLTKSLSQENQDWLKANRLQVPSYQESMSINKREVKLADDAEKKMLAKFMSEETEEAITTLRQNGGELNQERVNKRLELAHKRAWRRMKDEMEASPK